MYNYGYGYGYNSYSDEGLMALLAAGGAFSIILGLAAIVLSIIVWFRLFKKSGYCGGFVFIPFYSTYLMYKIAECAGMFWFFIIGAVVSALLTAASAEIGMVAWIIYLIAVIVCSIVYYVKLAHAFGKSGGFAAGLIFLNPIFMMILAFSNARNVALCGYGVTKCVSGDWECTCGAHNSASSLYCPNCSREKPRA